MGNIILCVLITIIVLLLTTVIMADYNRDLDGCDSPEGYYMNERYRCLKGWTTMLENGWPFGHNYANINLELPGVICVGLSSGRVSIDIPPTAPMIPTQPVYYVPVL